jgi:hypothetical protein
MFNFGRIRSDISFLVFPYSPERHGPAIDFNNQVGAGCKPQPLARAPVGEALSQRSLRQTMAG